MATRRKKAPKKPSQVCILTITGKDRVGIIARVSAVMAEANINIIDVNQKIMEEYFVMTMGCDIAAAEIGMDEIHRRLDEVGREMTLNITFQNETIFKMMHRI